MGTAKDLQIDYECALEFPNAELVTRCVLRDWMRSTANQGGTMKVFQPSTFLKHEDLDEQDWVVTIKNVTKEQVKSADGTSKEKFIVHFNECKPLVLNKTNMSMIIKLLGSNDSEDWVNRKITLFCKTDVEFGGELVSAIRVRSKLPL